MAVTRDPELERFKTEIDLRAFAAGQGYAWDKKESWRGSCVMRHPDGDKIVIKRDADGHYVYFSVRSDSDNGSVIDFCLNRKGLNLGQVRQTLRPWVKRGTADLAFGTAKLPAFPELEKTAKDRMEVERAYQLMADAPRHPYLENSRGLSPALLGSERFAGRVKIDGNGNAVFPHFDEEGLCGFEMKNREYTGFAKGGAKGLWFSRVRKDDNRLVLCESAIDALSHAALFPALLTRYASIGGQMNPRQPELIRMAIGRLPGACEVVAAMDADAQGQKLSAMILEAVARVAKETGRVDLGFATQQPVGFKDWNDQLRVSQTCSFPAVHL